MTFSDFNLSKCPDGLLPVIIQDAVTLRVLMLGYMNREAFDLTVASGRVTFFSRTRQKLWTKGETSGNFLDVVEMYADCDADTLLIKANPHGPTCHRGTEACFDTPAAEGFVRRLGEVVARRHTEMPDNSYTTRLFVKGLFLLRILLLYPCRRLFLQELSCSPSFRHLSFLLILLPFLL